MKDMLEARKRWNYAFRDKDFYFYFLQEDRNFINKKAKITGDKGDKATPRTEIQDQPQYRNKVQNILYGLSFLILCI